MARTRFCNSGKAKFNRFPPVFEKPEPVYRSTGQIFFKPGYNPVRVNRATAHNKELN
jgi:hypothetical protein